MEDREAVDDFEESEDEEDPDVAVEDDIPDDGPKRLSLTRRGGPVVSP